MNDDFDDLVHFYLTDDCTNSWLIVILIELPDRQNPYDDYFYYLENNFADNVYYRSRVGGNYNIENHYSSRDESIVRISSAVALNYILELESYE
jgi:hypothetical protein